MKLDRITRHRQRKALDARIRGFSGMTKNPPPRKGWVRAIRESLGMSSRQLAKRLGITVNSALELEAREVRGTASLEKLDKAARAMGCKLVYAIVPAEAQSLELILSARARETAGKQMRAVSHSMRLEDQSTSIEAVEAQIEELARVLQEKLDTNLWEK